MAATENVRILGSILDTLSLSAPATVNVSLASSYLSGCSDSGGITPTVNLCLPGSFGPARSGNMPPTGDLNICFVTRLPLGSHKPAAVNLYLTRCSGLTRGTNKAAP